MCYGDLEEGSTNSVQRNWEKNKTKMWVKQAYSE